MMRSTKLKLVAAVVAIAIVSFVVFLVSSIESPSLSAKIVRYAVAPDGVTRLAVLKLNNATGCPFRLPLSNARASRGVDEWRVVCQFLDKTPTGWTNRVQRFAPQSGRSTNIIVSAYSSLDVTVPLGPAGQVSKVAVICLPDLRNSTRTQDKVHLWLLAHLPVRYRHMSFTKVWCEEEL